MANAVGAAAFSYTKATQKCRTVMLDCRCLRDFCLLASRAAYERSFSPHSLTVSNKRNRLTNEHAGKLFVL